MTTPLAMLLGAVQGFTEFLPISSKTHLVVVPALLGRPSPPLSFIVLLHLGTLVALLAYFAKDLWKIVEDLPRENGEGRRMAGLLIIATIPAVVVGKLYEKRFDSLLTNPRNVATALIATAVILAAAEWASGFFGTKRTKPLRDHITTRDAIVIGISQVFAFLPGVSRSGTTMATGLARSLRRETAARFSFLMAIPALMGANVLEARKYISSGIGTPEIAGFAVSMVTGFLTVSVLLRYLRRWNFLPFAVYCAVFAVAARLALS